MSGYDLCRGIGIELGFDEARIDGATLMVLIDGLDPVLPLGPPVKLGPDNRQWVVKTSEACGWKLCSPSLAGCNRSLDILALGVGLLDFDKLNRPSEGVEFQVPITRKCFYHLHIDVSDLSREELLSVIQTAYRIENGLFRILPNSRRDTEAAVALHTVFSEYPEGPDVFKTLESINNCGVSLSDYMSRGTLEVRYAPGTKNTSKINFWIIFWTSLIERTLNFGPPEKDFENMTEISDWLGWPDGEDNEDLRYGARSHLLSRERTFQRRKRNQYRLDLQLEEAPEDLEESEEDGEETAIPEE